MTDAIERTIGSATLHVASDPGFLTATAGDERTYDRVLDMSGQYRPTSAHAIEATDASGQRYRLSPATGTPLGG